MTESYQVRTGDIAISDAILGIAAEGGHDVYSGLSGKYRPYLVFYTNQRHVGWNYGAEEKHQTVTVPKFIALLKERSQPVIKIGEWLVKFEDGGISVGCQFEDGGISVGCQFVDTAIVDAIHKRLHAPKGE